MAVAADGKGQNLYHVSRREIFTSFSSNPYKAIGESMCLEPEKQNKKNT